MYLCTQKNANEIWESHKIVNFQIYNELKKNRDFRDKN